MCELFGDAMQKATQSREWWAVVDCDGYGDLYKDRHEAARDVDTFNNGNVEHKPYRVLHLQEVES